MEDDAEDGDRWLELRQTINCVTSQEEEPTLSENEDSTYDRSTRVITKEQASNIWRQAIMTRYSDVLSTAYFVPCPCVTGCQKPTSKSQNTGAGPQKNELQTAQSSHSRPINNQYKIQGAEQEENGAHTDEPFKKQYTVQVAGQVVSDTQKIFLQPINSQYTVHGAGQVLEVVNDSQKTDLQPINDQYTEQGAGLVASGTQKLDLHPINNQYTVQEVGQVASDPQEADLQTIYTVQRDKKIESDTQTAQYSQKQLINNQNTTQGAGQQESNTAQTVKYSQPINKPSTLQGAGQQETDTHVSQPTKKQLTVQGTGQQETDISQALNKQSTVQEANQQQNNSQFLQSQPTSQSLSWIQDSDLRDDQSQLLMIQCLKTLTKPGPMVVLSQLDFSTYLSSPQFADVAGEFPRPVDFKTANKHRGDFDLLFLSRNHGILIAEIKSVGQNYGYLPMSEKAKDAAVYKRVTLAIRQLLKAVEVMTHLLSDLTSQPRVTTTLMMPYITRARLETVLTESPELLKDLNECLGGPSVFSVSDVLDMCVTKDVLGVPDQWWQRRMEALGSDPDMTDDVYLELVSRFAGPATTTTEFTAMSLTTTATMTASTAPSSAKHPPSPSAIPGTSSQMSSNVCADSSNAVKSGKKTRRARRKAKGQDVKGRVLSPTLSSLPTVVEGTKSTSSSSSSAAARSSLSSSSSSLTPVETDTKSSTPSPTTLTDVHSADTEDIDRLPSTTISSASSTWTSSKMNTVNAHTMDRPSSPATPSSQSSTSPASSSLSNARRCRKSRSAPSFSAFHKSVPANCEFDQTLSLSRRQPPSSFAQAPLHPRQRLMRYFPRPASRNSEFQDWNQDMKTVEFTKGVSQTETDQRSTCVPHNVENADKNRVFQTDTDNCRSLSHPLVQHSQSLSQAHGFCSQCGFDQISSKCACPQVTDNCSQPGYMSVNVISQDTTSSPVSIRIVPPSVSSDGTPQPCLYPPELPRSYSFPEEVSRIPPPPSQHFLSSMGYRNVISNHTTLAPQPPVNSPDIHWVPFFSQLPRSHSEPQRISQQQRSRPHFFHSFNSPVRSQSCVQLNRQEGQVLFDPLCSMDSIPERTISFSENCHPKMMSRQCRTADDVNGSGYNENNYNHSREIVPNGKLNPTSFCDSYTSPHVSVSSFQSHPFDAAASGNYPYGNYVHNANFHRSNSSGTPLLERHPCDTSLHESHPVGTHVMNDFNRNLGTARPWKLSDAEPSQK